MTKGAGRQCDDRGRDAPTPSTATAPQPLSKRPRLAKGDWAAFGARMTEFAEPRRRRRAEALLSSPHGHDRAVRGRHRRLHGGDQAARASAARHRPRDAGAARTRRLSPARYRDRIGHVHCKDVREDEDERKPTRRTELPRRDHRPRRRTRRLHRARRRHDRLRRGVPRAQGLFGLGGAGGRAGPEEGAGLPLREEGRRALARGAARRAGWGKADSKEQPSCRKRICSFIPAVGRRRAAPDHAGERRLALCRIRDARDEARRESRRTKPATGKSASSSSPARRG